MDIRVRFAVVGGEVGRLHARAFGVSGRVAGWGERLERHALTWVGAFEDDRLIGFVQVAWDGGAHAFVLDTAVDPDWQGRGVGATIVKTAVDEARRAGCEWVHVDYEPHLETFYVDRGGFRPTSAGLIHTR
nr:GNAT family N-acetyltransferase [uncultured Actinoplanes sp.]